MNNHLMKRSLCTAAMVACTLFNSTIMAQDKLSLPTLEDLIPDGETYRFAENIYGLQWWGDLCIRPKEDRVVAIDPQSGKENLLFTLEQVNNALKEAGLKPMQHLSHRGIHPRRQAGR